MDTFNRIHHVNCILLRHNGTDVQERLKAMGYCPLSWSVTHQPEQKLIASSQEHTVNSGTFHKPDNKHYEGCFWNGGIGPVQSASNLFDCGDDEKLFTELAGRLIREKYIYFDEKWDPCDKPDYMPDYGKDRD